MQIKRQNNNHSIGRGIVLAVFVMLFFFRVALQAQNINILDPQNDLSLPRISYFVGDTLTKTKWSDGLYLSASVGPQRPQLNTTGVRLGVGASVSIGKIISKTQSLQLTLEVDDNKQSSGVSLVREGLSLAYLYNISSMLSGYQSGRRIEYQALVGGGVQNASTQYKVSQGFFCYAGFQGKMHLNANVDAFIEPTIGIGSSELSLINNQPHEANLMYRVNAGLRYIFHPKDFSEKMDPRYLPYYLFYSSSVGAQHQIDAPDGWGIGPTAALSVGRWFNHGFGARWTIALSTDTWHQALYDPSLTRGESYSVYERAAYGGLRTECLFDPLMFVRTFREKDHFRMYMSAGIEFGQMEKYSFNRYLNRTYFGLTGGLHLAWQFNPMMALFLEPHYTLVNYTLPYELAKERRRFSDQLGSASIGIEMSTRPANRRSLNSHIRKYHHGREFHVIPLFLEAGGGPVWPLSICRETGQITKNGSFKMAIGYEVHPLLSFALEGRVTSVNVERNKAIEEETMFGSALQFRFNIANLVLGYRGTRVHDVDTKISLGPSLALKEGRSYVGGECGLINSFHFGEHMSLSLAPKVNVYPSAFLNQNKVVRASILFAIEATYSYAM